jgi:hypothetical protein
VVAIQPDGHFVPQTSDLFLFEPFSPQWHVHCLNAMQAADPLARPGVIDEPRDGDAMRHRIDDLDLCSFDLVC